jgi:hypothetical protein
VGFGGGGGLGDGGGGGLGESGDGGVQRGEVKLKEGRLDEGRREGQTHHARLEWPAVRLVPGPRRLLALLGAVPANRGRRPRGAG